MSEYKIGPRCRRVGCFHELKVHLEESGPCGILGCGCAAGISAYRASLDRRKAARRVAREAKAR